MPLLLDLFLTFAKVGAMTFGGGYAMLPILQREVAEKKGWADEDQLADYYAVGQCTPGVIAVNAATFVGASQGGVPGGIAATLGLVFPSVVIILAIASFLSGLAHLPAVAHAFNGVRAGVTALILSSVIKIFRGAVKDRPTRIIYLAVLTLSVFRAILTPPPALAAAWRTVTSPVFLVLFSGAAGLTVRAVKGGGKE